MNSNSALSLNPFSNYTESIFIALLIIDKLNRSRFNISFSIVAELNPFYTKRFESLYLKKEFLVCCFVNNCGERESVIKIVTFAKSAT